MRDADDVVGALQPQGDAERFYQAWGQRLRQCGLAAAAKTRVTPCSRHQVPGHTSVEVVGQFHVNSSGIGSVNRP